MPIGIYNHKPHTEETKQKIRETNKGKYYHSKWTEEKNKELIKMRITDKYSIKQIAKKLGVSIATVGRKLSSLGLRRKHKQCCGKFFKNYKIKKLRPENCKLLMEKIVDNVMSRGETEKSKIRRINIVANNKKFLDMAEEATTFSPDYIIKKTFKNNSQI